MPKSLELPPLKYTQKPHTAAGRFLTAGGSVDATPHHAKHAWYWVIWLSGVDYFSTLGYQPGIALLAAQALSPVATGILILVTLLGALPVYGEVAARSYAGQGSIAMLENLLHGWRAKVFTLVLLGFAATDFVITMTLSAADAAVHACQNPLLRPFLGDHSLVLTVLMLLILAAIFVIGFREAISLASAVCIPYIVLNVVVIIAGLHEIAGRPELWDAWHVQLGGYADTAQLLLAATLIFPKLALGMSGFETGVSVMPLVRGGEEDKDGRPRGRILATRKLLITAAAMMSVMLVASSVVTTLLVPPEAYHPDGPAAGRVIAYLAHELLGPTFGSLYDLSTISILWFAGASAMTGLLNLIPRYLPRFGMAPLWTTYSRPLVIMLCGIDVLVTLIFKADVETQSGAYATGVLVLILSAAIAVTIALSAEFRATRSFKKLAQAAYFTLVSLVFIYTLIANIVERPDGVIIASAFIAAIIFLGAFSRYRRATELRVTNVSFVDQESAVLWLSMVGKTVNLVPIHISTPASRKQKTEALRKHYRMTEPLAFVHVALADNRSDFTASVKVQVREEDGNVVVDVTGATAIANTIAYLSELIDPIRIFLDLTRKNLMAQSLRYLLWGEGEVALSVYQILLRHWEATPEEDVRPYIFLMSE